MPGSDNKPSSGTKAEHTSQQNNAATTAGQLGTASNENKEDKAAQEKATKEYLERMELEYAKREGGA
jgi:hypothetical protein